MCCHRQTDSRIGRQMDEQIGTEKKRGTCSWQANRRYVFYDISSLANATGTASERNHFILLTVVTKIAYCQLPTAVKAAAAQ